MIGSGDSIEFGYFNIFEQFISCLAELSMKKVL